MTAILTLERLLAPHEECSFLEDILGQSALYVPGTSGKFQHLFSWATLNHLLEFGGLRLFRCGQEIPRAFYCRTGQSGYERPLVRELTSQMREGAMLAIESIEELHEPVSVQCQALERKLRIPVLADLYANCWDRPSAPLRRNDHDVIILQTEGARNWQIHCPTSGNPSAAANVLDEPSGDPAWHGVVNANDLLYVPRGWWYRDEPVGEHAMCLALKFKNPTGMDLAGRLIGTLCGSRRMNSAIPRFAGPERQSNYLRNIRYKLSHAVTDGGLLLGFLTDAELIAETRHGFCLPWCAHAVPLPPSDDWFVVPLLRFPDAGAPIRHLDLEDVFEIVIDGQVFRFCEESAGVIQYILEREGVTLSSLVAAWSSSIPAERVLECLIELVKCGAICFRERNALERPFRAAERANVPTSV